MHCDRLCRDGLIARVRQANAAVHVIVAPGGFGKSTLVCDTLQTHGEAVAWYSISARDDDVTIFLSHLSAALSAVHAPLSKRIETMGTQAWRETLLALLKAIETHEKVVHLVLDDLHHVAKVADIRALLRALINDAPPNLRLYLVSREQVQVPLARLRAQQRVVEIRSGDLRLSRGEVERLLIDLWKLNLSGNAVDMLAARSGGWLAALVLIRLAVQRLSNAEMESFVARLGAEGGVLFDYLGEEVLAKQPAALQRFLKRTSILDGFDVDSAAGAAGEPNAARFMAELEAKELFIVRQDSNPPRYHYHELFLTFLREALRRELGAEGVRARHAMAADWYLERDPVCAIDHLLAAAKWDDAVGHMECQAPALLQRGRVGRVGEWINALPLGMVSGNPNLLLICAAVFEAQGNWALAVSTYRDALNRLREGGPREAVVLALERMSLCMARCGDWDQMQQALNQAMHRLAGEVRGNALRARLHALLGANVICQGGDIAEAHELVREGYRMSQGVGDRASMWICAISQGFVSFFAQGAFNDALRVLGDALALSRELDQPYMIAQTLMNTALVQVFNGQLDAAEASLTAAGHDCNLSSDSFLAVAIRSVRAKILLERGRLDECDTLLGELARTDVPLHLRPWLLRTQVLLNSRLGKHAAALECGAEMLSILTAWGGQGMYAPECYLAAAVAESGAGRYAAARRLAAQALEVAEAGEMRFWCVKSQLVLARVALEEGEQGHLSRHLRTAFEGTHRWGYRHLWTDVALLRSAVAHGIERPCAIDLMRGLGASVDARGAERIQIRTLGGFSIVGEGAPVQRDLRRKQVLKLLKYMLSRRNLTMSVDEAIEVFWPSMGPTAVPNLRTQMYHLRNLIDPQRRTKGFQTVESHGDGYCLKVNAWLDIDWVRFKARVADGERLLRSGHRAEALSYFLDAVQAYTGDFLPEDRYEDWTASMREELRAMYRRTLLTITELQTEPGSSGDALDRLKRLLDCDPTDEAVFLQVLHCEGRQANRTGVIRAWHSYARRLREEYGLGPSETARDVLRGVLGEDAEAMLAPRTAQAKAPAISSRRRSASTNARS